MVLISLSEQYFTGKAPANEIQIYTWKDASLKELTSLIREVNAIICSSHSFCM